MTEADKQRLESYKYDLEVYESEFSRISRWIQEKRDFGYHANYTYQQLEEEQEDWKSEIDDLKDKIIAIEEV